MGDLLVLIISLVVAYNVGSLVEKRHYKSIKEREIRFLRYPSINFSKNVIDEQSVVKSELVSASVVIACDFFKYFVAGLKTIFGGNISAYESVLDRGRREAILRIKEKALSAGAGSIVNLKIETIMLDPPNENQKNVNAPKVCVVAYGTALTYAK